MDEVDLDSKAVSKLRQQVESRLSNKNSKISSLPKPGKKSRNKPVDNAGGKKQTINGTVGDQTSPKKDFSLHNKPKKLNSDASKALIKNGLFTKKGENARTSHPGSTKTSSLKQEVLALGGNEEDLKLIEDVGSDSELDTSKAANPDKSLQDDLSKFMKKLPFKEVQVDASEDSAGEDQSSVGEGHDHDVSIDHRQNMSSTDLVIAPQSEWYSVQLASFTTSEGKRLPEKTIQELLQYGKELLKTENHTYSDINKSNSSYKFYKEMMVSGTLTDKISALTLSVQESPIHNQQPLETLVALAKKRSRSQAVQVLGALKDLFGTGTLLPSDRRLRHFTSQPSLLQLPFEVFKNWTRKQPLPQPLLKQHLIVWVYEDWLKSTYFDIIKVLETWSNDEITYSRLRSVDYVSDLLKEKPEQEANLLNLLVNKLGDPEKQVASRASSHLVQLQIPHPFMKSVIISNIEANVLFKPGETWHAKYYAIITLNQTVLNSGQQEVVQRLLDIYFAMFLSLLQEKENPSKGPLGSHQGEKLNSKDKKRSKKTKGPTTNDVDIQEKVISGILSGINRAYPYAASKDDFFEKRLDTLYKITHSSNFSTSIQALMLLQQLTTAHSAASDRFYRTLYESLLDPRLLTTSKHALYINLMYRSLKADTNVKRVQAFVKRLGQIIAMHQPPFVCAIIYLIKDLEDTFPVLHSLVDQPEAYDEEEDDDDSKDLSKLAYDGKKRDPQFSNADRCCIWEMHPLSTHFHPSVSLSVSKLLANQKIESKPDLSLHTLINFLDRFVYRNPKKVTDALKGVSLMQPMAIANTADMLISGRASGKRKGPALNTMDFARMNDEKVQADEVFFHKYFSVKEQGKALAQRRREKKQQNVEQEDEADNEEEIWKALIDSRPELGDDESDVFESDDFSDMESNGEEDRKADEASFSDEDMGLEDDEDDALFDSDEAFDLPDSVSQDEDASETSGHADSASARRPQKKRKLLRDLPTFASAEDYASMMQDEEEQI